MSPAAARRLHRHERHVCGECRNHPARFRYRGEVRAPRPHALLPLLPCRSESRLGATSWSATYDIRVRS